MPRCARKGCNQEFVSADNPETGCHYHPGIPVFHEGLKSWSCCSSINKPVLDFDEFMAIPGCQVGAHTEAVQQTAPQVSKPAATILTMTESKDGKEVYSAARMPQSHASSLPTIALPAESLPFSFLEEEDDLNTAVTPGTQCKRRGCSVTFTSDVENRIGNGEGAVCTYHPAPPIFREGSKGYLCCKRRVLEFEEFLKIEGCKKGRHVFVVKQNEELVNHRTEQFMECRVDHYQTPNEVHVSVFAKQVDKEKSRVTIERTQVHFDLYFPAQKRFKRTIPLFGPVEPGMSSFKFLGTKVEVILKKLDTRSWTVLEKTTHDLGNISLTFGVGGRTGTIGGKEIMLDEKNRTRAL